MHPRSLSFTSLLAAFVLLVAGLPHIGSPSARAMVPLAPARSLAGVEVATVRTSDPAAESDRGHELQRLIDVTHQVGTHFQPLDGVGERRQLTFVERERVCESSYKGGSTHKINQRKQLVT